MDMFTNSFHLVGTHRAVHGRIWRNMMFASDNQVGGILPQTLLKQRFAIVEPVEQNSVRALYRGIDTHNGNHRVAILEMSQAKPGAAEPAEATGNMLRESSLLSSLHHPNVPHIYAIFSEQGHTYLVMDYIEGKTLRQLIQENGGHALPTHLVLVYIRQLCDALAYLYQHNPPIIFRDIQPSNVMLAENGVLFLVDFRIMGFSRERTGQGVVIMGPSEQPSRAQSSMPQADPRPILYGLGATLHYCLTGKEPDHTAEGLAFPPVRPHNPQVPLELEQLVQRLVSINKQQPEVSAFEVQQVLMHIHQHAGEYTANAAPHVSSPGTSSAAPFNNNPLAAGQAPSTDHVSRRGILSHLALVWTPRFVLLLVLLLAFTLGGSLYALNTMNSLDHIIEFCLSLILVIACIASGSSIYSFRLLPWGILLSVALAVLLSGLAFLVQATPLAQRLMANSISVGELNQIVTFGLLAAAIISLFWLARPFIWLDRVVLLFIFGAAAFSGIYQSRYRDETVLQHVYSNPRLLQYAIRTEALHKHTLLIGVMVILLLGILVAAQMERVHERTRGTVAPIS
jgi:Protein kinase domain